MLVDEFVCIFRPDDFTGKILKILNAEVKELNKQNRKVVEFKSQQRSKSILNSHRVSVVE